MIDHFQLLYDGRKCSFLPGDTVLDCLERNSIAIAASCYDGICGVCTLRSEGPAVPSVAQGSLRSAQCGAGFFLACQCPARADLVLVPRNRRTPIAGYIQALSTQGGLTQIALRSEAPFSARAGQTLSLHSTLLGRRRLPIIERSDDHSARVALGCDLESAGLSSSCRVGDQVQIEDWQGECFYFKADEEPLLLLGSGERAGQAFMALLQEASKHGHRGEIGFYLEGVHRLSVLLERQLETLHQNGLRLRRIDAFSVGHAATGQRAAKGSNAFTGGMADLSLTRIYLCGPRLFIRRTKRAVVAAGGTLHMTHIQEISDRAPLP